MLTTLSISNYVIIDNSEIHFAPGLNMITGETGAGKSILLGAIGLILGRRADTQVLFDPTIKAIVEAVFHDTESRVSSILKAFDLEEGPEVVLRREITPNGRSRAFVNDTPVTLDTMSEVGTALMDIHQQFETLEIQQTREQYHVLDAYSGLQPQRIQYQHDFDRYTQLLAQLASLRDRQVSAMKEKDYLTFQLNEFDTIQLDPVGIAAMEEEYQLQSGAEEIKSILAAAIESLTGERGLSDQIRTHIRAMNKQAQGNTQLTGFVQKLQVLLDEYLDLAKDMTIFEEKLEPDPKRRLQLEEKLNILNRIMLKHGARDANELIEKHKGIINQLEKWANLDTEIHTCEKELSSMRQSLENQAKVISSSRRNWAPKLAQLVSKGLHELSMKHAVLHIEVSDSEELHSYGKDNVEFLFAPNLGSEPKPVKKVASGGELSRLNLCLKSAVSDQMQLPTLVFDEIDAGVSGEVALQMGQKLKTLSKDHQVIMITHSPQIAAQAGHHLQVTKSDTSGRSIARIHTLLPEERITEIAKMLSGDPPTKAAVMNAKTLINT